MIIHFPQVLYPWFFLEKFIKNRSFQKLRLKIIIICSPLIQSTLLIYYNEFIRLYFNINEKINQNGYFLFNLYFFCFILVSPLFFVTTIVISHNVITTPFIFIIPSPASLVSVLLFPSFLPTNNSNNTKTQKPKNPKKTVTALSIHP